MITEETLLQQVRDHLGEFVVLWHDAVLGPFETYGEAVKEGYGRFGDVQLVVKEIRPQEPPDFVPLVDLNHPAIKLLGKSHGWISRRCRGPAGSACNGTADAG